MYTDSHCHLDFPGLRENLPAVLERMRQAGVSRALCVSVTLEDFPQVLALAQASNAGPWADVAQAGQGTEAPQLFASVGVHPDYPDCEEPTVDGLVRLSDSPKIIATGETGLDYFRANTDPGLTHEWQRERFRVHIRAARITGKPLIIHTRSASDDTIRIMAEEQAGVVGGVMHCFTETLAVARAALDLGFYISFSGIVTFKNAEDLREVARFVPLERMLIETDSPYLAPVPHRGKTNEPAFVSHVGDYLATLRGVDVEAFAHLTSQNFDRCFRLSPTA
jgi:TatD DNase family protein